MHVILNGVDRETHAATIAALLATLSIDQENFLAVSRNGTIVRRHEWETTPIAAGDRIDILTIVGGG